MVTGKFLSPERYQRLVRFALQHMSLEERARAEIPILGATEREIRQLKRRAVNEAKRCAHLFKKLKTYCMFIGYPRSGHSLIGSLMDAHSNMLIAHELDTLRFIRTTNFTAAELYWLLYENSRLFATVGRQWGEYSYGVPGMDQGAATELTVVGDKKGGGTTQTVARNPQLLDKLRQLVPLPIKIIHSSRNPFDNIASIAAKHTGNLPQAIQFYFSLSRTNQIISDRFGTDDVLHLHHEDLVTNPRAVLRQICLFVGVSASQDYLDACATVVADKLSRPRDKVNWTDNMKTHIEKEIRKYPFLSGYDFDN